MLPENPVLLVLNNQARKKMTPQNDPTQLIFQKKRKREKTDIAVRKYEHNKAEKNPCH